MKSVLDDDDVALIDLVSKADLGRENVEKGSYYAETYDKNGIVWILLVFFLFMSDICYFWRCELAVLLLSKTDCTFRNIRLNYGDSK